jgi:hypothetical protein
MRLVPLIVLTGAAILASPEVAHAEARGDLDLEASAGASRTWLDLPTNDARTQLALALAIGLRASPDVAISARGTVDIGEGPTTTTALGVHVRLDRGRYFAGIGPAIAHVAGPVDASRSFSSMPPAIDSLALLVDLRAGIRISRAYVAVELMPLFAFSDVSVAADADLGAALHAGVAVGVAY